MLLTLERPNEAEVLAERAAISASALSSEAARGVEAAARGVQRSSLTELAEHDRALEIDEQLVARFADSTSSERRLDAGRALRHAVWTYGHLGLEPQAIKAAQRLVDLVGEDPEPEHLVAISELLLSGAESLNYQRIWRRASPPVTRQVHAMCGATLVMAAQVGGDLGDAVALSAALTRDDALFREHRLRSAVSNHFGRRSPNLSMLPALRKVEEEARDAGSERRYLTLVMIHATALAEDGQTQEALATLDELGKFKARGSMLTLIGPLAVKALRRKITSAT